MSEHAIAQPQKIASPANTSGHTGLLQRKCACGGSPGLTGECEKCQRKRLLGIQTKLVISQPGDRFEAEADRVADRVMHVPDRLTPSPTPRLQRQAITSVGPAPSGLAPAPPAVHEVLNSPGQPLDAGTRSFMESRFGHDFSQVKIHTNDRASRSAELIKARAYTVGHDIVLGAGQHAPETIAGKHLLAHELAHVAQQTGLDHTTQRFIQRQSTLDSTIEWFDKKKNEFEAAEKAKIPVGDTSLPSSVERDVKWHLKNSKRQEALDVLVGHLASTGKINLHYLDGGKMFFDDALSAREGQAEAKPGPGGSVLVKVSIGIGAFDPPIAGDPTKRAGPNITWLYTSVLHEYQHVLQIHGTDGGLAKIADVEVAWTKRYIRDIEAYAEEIKEASNTGLDKKPDLMEDIWQRLHEDNWLKLNNKPMLAKPKVQAILTKTEKERLNKLYEAAYKTAKAIVGKPLGYAPFKLP